MKKNRNTNTISNKRKKNTNTISNKKRKKNTITISKKKRIDSKISIQFFNRINEALEKFHKKFGDKIFSKNIAEKCYEFCCLNFTTSHQYNIYCDKCVKYINVVNNCLDEIMWYKTLEQQYKLKGFVYYRGGYLPSILAHIKEDYKNKHYTSKLEKEIDKISEFFYCFRDYNLLMNENLMGLESGLIKQISLRDKLEQDFMSKKLDSFIREVIEDDILKTATQLV